VHTSRIQNGPFRARPPPRRRASTAETKELFRAIVEYRQAEVGKFENKIKDLTDTTGLCRERVGRRERAEEAEE
jgi:hypothetical protein